ncbi:hypothetical protein [Paludibaculum fermentans]|uniref:Uncharacterized protein n=1 Tax=Paludibaculum fermentans TaxID=1473598 RepID=A0A7S7SP53_PALFE|nr:hypothetical protein [Paludibaculum fermentans]QOY91206.1 hypothetical protein IRI77_15035 [Paludibaculum fermentans]
MQNTTQRLKFGLGLALALGLAGTAHAQYSSPVREVTNPVNTLVAARCSLNWTSGQTGNRSCGQQIGEIDKRVILNTVTVQCEGASGAKFVKARLDFSIPPEGSDQTGLYFPLTKSDEAPSDDLPAAASTVVTGLMLDLKPPFSATKPYLTFVAYKEGSGAGRCNAIFYGNVQPK